jgi:hypothetical protein
LRNNSCGWATFSAALLKSAQSVLAISRARVELEQKERLRAEVAKLHVH